MVLMNRVFDGGPQREKLRVDFGGQHDSYM
jgi:hypothetical protein